MGNGSTSAGSGALLERPATPAAGHDGEDPVDRTETRLAELLAAALQRDSVPVDAHFFDDLGADSMLMTRFCARVRKAGDLPAVAIPDVYQHPTVRDLAAALAGGSGGSVETALAGVLAGVLGVERVPVDAHFFDDLGADSMLMTRFCARVRKAGDLPAVAIQDVYQHPTVRGLAAALGGGGTTPPAAPADPAPDEGAPPVGTGRYVLCGVLQVSVVALYALVTAGVVDRGFSWIVAASGPVELYLRAVAVTSGAFAVVSVLPVLAKWALIGRWTAGRVRIWSLGYVRFWTVKTLLVLNPVVVFAGSPLYSLYLRALGARIGRGVVVLTRHVPVCTDLLTIGEGTVVRKDAYLTGYTAVAGWIRTGPVLLGRDAFVGEKAVLDIGTSVGDGAQLGHVSSLHEGQSVPPGEHWHGSPARPTDTDYRTVPAMPVHPSRRAAYGLLQLGVHLLVTLPSSVAGVLVLLVEVPALAVLLDPGSFAASGGEFLRLALVTSLLLFTGGTLAGLVLVATVPRLLFRLVPPGRVLPLYGLAYAAQRGIARMTNRRFYVELFGDSSYITGYLRWVGYRLRPLVQTGSNFGSELKHEIPYLTSVGPGTVIASGLSIADTDFSSTSFRADRVTIGRENFFGNDIVYPSQSRTGDDVLLATKVLVPIDGPVRTGVGLLGSPSFAIPRTVSRDAEFASALHKRSFPRRLRAKNRHNLRTMAWWLLAKWGYVLGLTLIGFLAADLHGSYRVVAIAVAELTVVVFTLFYVCLVERASTGFRGVRPISCSIYSVGFWRSERFFKLQAGAGLHAVFIGTPLQSWFWRLVGVRLGRRLFDDGCGMSEKNLVTLGDDVTLNVGSFIQCHSQEDYAFKSDRTAVGSRTTIGVGALVHYGVTVGADVVLAPDSFLMKGEEVPDGAHWGGNPARELRAARPAGPAPAVPAPAPPAPGAADAARPPALAGAR